MFCAILKATNSSFQKCMTLCRSIYVKEVMKLLAFIFEQPSYITVIFRKIKTILILVSFKRYFSHPEKSVIPGLNVKQHFFKSFKRYFSHHEQSIRNLSLP